MEHTNTSHHVPTKIRNWHHALQQKYAFLIFKKYFIWVVFILEMFLLTNLFSSLSLIDAYGIPFFDVFLTYGFLGFVYLFEAFLFTFFLTLVQLAIEKFLSANPSTVFMAILLTILIVEWTNLFLTIFNKALI